VPLVVRVLRNAGSAAVLERVVVATDDRRIMEAVARAAGEARMTPPELPSGSDRVARIADELENEGERFDVVVNLQGDEPFLPPQAVDAAVEALARDPKADVATLVVPLAEEARARPEVVKALVDREGIAVDFTRRDPADGQAERHLGLYAYRREYLARFVGLPPSPRETAERLEQLRALEDGARIRAVRGNWPGLGIDTPADLEEARRRVAAN